MTADKQKGPGLLQVATDAYAWIQPEGGTNSGFIVGPAGVVVIDSLMSPSLARGLIAQVRSVTDKPVIALINTHFHGDHVFGNQFFPEARIISHTLCRAELEQLGQGYVDQMAQQMAEWMPAMVEELKQVKLTLPVVTFTDSMSVYVGGREIRLLYLGWAHTKGDLVVYLPDSNLLYAGDVSVHGTFPYVIDGRLGSWIQVIDSLLGLSLGTVVPGHGLLGDRSDVEGLKQTLIGAHREVRGYYDRGMSQEEAAKALNLAAHGPVAPEMAADMAQMVAQRLYLEFRGELS